MENYKSDIINSRSIGFGSSDAATLLSVGRNGKLNKTAEKRIAVMLGQAEQKEFSTKSTKYGDYIENAIYETVKNTYPEYEVISNPYYQVDDLPYRFKCFNHIDIEIKQPHRIIWFEVKAVNDDLQKTIKKYEAQLCWHWWILKHIYRNQDVTVELFLAHYHTKDKHSEFNPKQLTLQSITFDESIYDDIQKGIDVVEKELDRFQYEAGTIIQAENLPEELNEAISQIHAKILSIKKAEQDVESFKQNLLQAMQENNINKISLPDMDISYVSSGESLKFNTPQFKKSHPRLYKKFARTEKRKAYINIRIKDKTDGKA
ncbi:hypothetical protein D0T53_11035 [Dysgonomonas sp. 216]|uniref:hypothetical protein n=1 Tax=Dysgonomonas sp. 216 TaxID=2302934 RepID=UPI0013D2A40D|nr:hypothetical protein [Dysgonomonas sp. 216]NDW19439.1 hypothetical protein [Dysgonomonas sp. 216]